LASCQENSTDLGNQSAQDTDSILFRKFQNFCEKYTKIYDTPEIYFQRLEIFKNNYISAKGAMANDTSSDHLEYKLGTTQFSDMTPEEFQTQFLGLSANMTDLNTTTKFFDESNDTSSQSNLNFLSGSGEETSSAKPGDRLLQSLPVNFDWRDYGAVTSVKTQGSCGGCWAFSANGVIEGQISIKYKKSISLSNQQLIDCDFGNSGCSGGMMGPAFNYIMRAGGIMTQSSYPYLGYQNFCRYNANAVVARVTGWSSAGSTNESVIMAFLYRTGPLAITMNANTLQYYRGGVYNAPYSQCPINPTHGVLLVGYGVTSTGLPYWTMKNSWGPNWGEGGYFRMRRGISLCGVNQYVVSATIQ
jgi:cathepsin F